MEKVETSVWESKVTGVYEDKMRVVGKYCSALGGFLHALRLVEMTVLFYHRNFTFGETSLVIDKLHFP